MSTVERDREDGWALEESINDWKKKAFDIRVDRQCPLCTLGESRHGKQYSVDKCTDCIIKKYTGKNECHNTPYWKKSVENNAYCNNMIVFLTSLRPEKKVKEIIEIGDQVTLYDSSYLIRLNNGKIGDRYDKQLLNAFNNGKDDTHYIVLETGTRLPEGSNHKGEYGNDTIIYNPEDGSYIFTRMKYLKLVEPKHCSECGKAK